MKEIRKEDRMSLLVEQLLDVWERSVRETHLFLSAFMGIDGIKLEMLFVSPKERGRGLGRKLLEYSITEYGVKELTVNEQNPQAKEFYDHMGFRVRERSEIDEQGNPYPILFMELKSGN